MNTSQQILYERMFTIRVFEERLLELFKDGKIFGTTHTCIGQEAIALSIMEHLKPDDLVFSGHRCHGHFLARFDDPRSLLAEMMGRTESVCAGRGGSQHLYRDGFLTNGVQGGYMPIALGAAKAEQVRGKGSIVVAVIGDGTLGEGTVYETFNMASLWQVPLLVVIENNRYAQSTPVSHNLAGKIVERPRAFGLEAEEIESNDINELLPWFAEAIEAVRNDGRPRVRVVHTYRLGPHSKGDDFRKEDEIMNWRTRDPLLLLGVHIEDEEKVAIENRVRMRLTRIEEEVDVLPFALFAD